MRSSVSPEIGHTGPPADAPEVETPALGPLPETDGTPRGQRMQADCVQTLVADIGVVLLIAWAVLGPLIVLALGLRFLVERP